MRGFGPFTAIRTPKYCAISTSEKFGRTAGVLWASYTTVSTVMECEYLPAPKRDDCFYDDPVIFLVENVLFRKPRRPFAQESEVFRNMFELPVPEGSVVDGSSDEHPLRLEGVSSADFRYFLKVLFPLPSTAPTHAVTTGGGRQDEWIAVLKLSTMWICDNVKKVAIEMLSGIVNNPVERIADAEKLGLEYVWKVAKVRESYGSRAAANAYGLGYPLSGKALPPLSVFDFTSTICSVFDIDRSGKPAPKISRRGAY
ncbi:hypothetical protein A0H81_05020 [Grifola frondosa]|uniref:BTB domain-containing protein n=1 Tax=Grifola frondosa TaxID=5627 RepID=A0A1C7MDX7_GRIFR|nr:hypothetical protein A0H81_05020 [Grifola frondosa]